MGSSESNDDDHKQEVQKQIMKQAKVIVLKIWGVPTRVQDLKCVPL